MAISHKFRGKQKYCIIYRRQGVTCASRVKTFNMSRTEMESYLSKYSGKLI